MSLVKFFIGFVLCSSFVFAQSSQVKIGILQYDGGGDWYANKTSIPNLIQASNKILYTAINEQPDYVRANDEIYHYPFVHMTGHGNVVFSSEERKVLRHYLLNGGFLHIDDNYGLDQYVRKEIALIFPDYQLLEIPFKHSIFHQMYDFDNGVPKVHLHDDKPAVAYAIVHEGRIVLLYTYESDLGNGWEDKDVHFDEDLIRQKAMEMGINIISYVFTSSKIEAFELK
jgi:hypothetical protein